jgi:hypothetical protein
MPNPRGTSNREKDRALTTHFMNVEKAIQMVMNQTHAQKKICLHQQNAQINFLPVSSNSIYHKTSIKLSSPLMYIYVLFFTRAKKKRTFVYMMS